MEQDTNQPTAPNGQQLQQLQAFKERAHGLRISASNVAAMAGFHPWKNLPELFLMDGVYQGRSGKLLLQHDLQLLNIEIVDEELILQQLAAKAGVSASVQQALQVKRGSLAIDTIQTAAALKQSVLTQQATEKLTVNERKLLTDGVRHAVNTGYGTFHEDAALDIYEQQVGDRVFARNAEVRIQEYGVDNNNNRVAPLSGPRIYRTAAASTSATTSADTTESAKDDEHKNDSSDTTSNNETDSNSKTSQQTTLPLFSILGSVDGIREELDTIREDDDWTFRQVVVECKHRMNNIKSVPPLYEQIQTVAYCFLYNVNHADILQVLRRQVPEPKRPRLVKEEEEESSASTDPTSAPESATASSTPIDDGDPSKSSTTKTDKENAAMQPPPDNPIANESSSSDSNESGSSTIEQSDSKKAQPDDDTGITISISRVSLDDPIMQHRQQWNETILPRLRLFVQAVYNVRADDHKRYRMLAAVSEESDEAWKFLFEECPWLEHCDTAFRNKRLAASVD